MTTKRSERRISKAHDRAKRLTIDEHSKIVLFSDIHRGRGSGADDFARNQKLYHTALRHYHREGYTYIELGDGDELWQERHMWEITAAYDHIFTLLAALYRDGRLHMLYGNHDKVKKDANWVRQNLQTYSPKGTAAPVSLFPDITVEEAVLLEHRDADGKLLLLHGHQADFFNYRLWWFARFLVRYIWQPLELVGFRNPFDAEQNPKRRTKVEKILARWTEKTKTPIVAGHTHRPVFPPKPAAGYYNTGSSVHTRYITAIELTEGAITLVKWEIAAREDGALYITREALSSSRPIAEIMKRTHE
ncbi:MAG: metallophosphoesterase [Oscillospiraceae bacterium]|nr:metallophosphoesterase [Oscillospiraceae bacterium]